MFQKLKFFLFENQGLKQKIAKNTFWLFFGQIFGRLIRVAIVVYAARILGPASWGAFSYAMSFAAFMSIFSDVGVNAIVTKESSRNPELANHYFSTALGIKLLLLTAGMILVIFGAPFITKIEEAKILLPIIALVILFDSLRNFGFAISRAKEKMELEGLNEIITNFFISSLGFLALQTSKSSYALTIGYAIAVAIGFGLIAFQLRHYFRNFFSYFDWTLIKPILKTAWPFALASSLGAIMINTDTLILGWLKTAEAVGWYSAAQRPVQLLYVLPTLFAVSLFPNLSRLAKNDPKRFKAVFLGSLKIALAAALPITVVGIIFGQEIINLLFGLEYQNAVLPFQILMATILIIFPSAIVTNASLAADQQKNFIIFSLLGAFGNVILDIILIPKYGLAGCAAATVFTQIIANSFIWYKLKRELKL
ncbi:MAG: flippase [Candidatus Harrisonbacteria bacterium]|nr:flippase [Candidatus Harrisonbacteria bacterium]